MLRLFYPSYLCTSPTKFGLFDTLEKGIFGGVKRPKDGGKGLNGVVSKDENYYNPFVELMLNK